MAYNEKTEARINRTVSRWRGIGSLKMFGGICYLLKGNMFCGIYKEFLILRLGEKGAAEALGSAHVRPMDITGKPMKGWVMVEPAGFRNDELLNEWLNEAREFAETLPPKKKS